MPPRKDQVERQAWQWAETTAPEDVSMEHMLAAYILHPPHNKKTACKSVTRRGVLIGLGLILLFVSEMLGCLTDLIDWRQCLKAHYHDETFNF